RPLPERLHISVYVTFRAMYRPFPVIVLKYRRLRKEMSRRNGLLLDAYHNTGRMGMCLEIDARSTATGFRRFLIPFLPLFHHPMVIGVIALHAHDATDGNRV